jgi:trimethylamine--corrinoid protein Co-methyltransferase
MKRPNSSPGLAGEFSVLTDSQISDLHLAALEVLRRTGVRFHHAEALEMLERAGATVSDGNLVRFPAKIVEDAIASVPQRVVMCDRNGGPALSLEGRRVYFGTGSDSIHLIDPRSGVHRRFTEADIIDGYRLCDALPNIDFVMSIGFPADVDVGRTYDVQMARMLEYTTKPIVFVVHDRAGCQRAIDMAAVVAGGQEALREQRHVLLYSEPSSPLQQSETAVDKLLLMAEHDLPVVHSPGALMGGTAPITMAGGLAMSLAEILSGLVVHQLERPGAPFVFGAGLHHMDMRAAQICYGAPEFQLTKSAIAEIGRWYGMPTWGYAGCSDAKVMDEQAALECLFSVVMARLSGPNLVHDVGYMQSGLASCYEMIVLTDELIAMTDPLVKGIEVSDDTLMLDELDRAGPGGSFVETEETLNRFRDFWYPRLLDRSRRERWLDRGSSTLGDRLEARVQEILDEHRPEPLEARTKQGLDAILSKAGA